MDQSRETRDHRGHPSGRTVVTLLCLVVLLMAFALAAGLVAQPILAAVAGTGAVSLAGQAARWLVSSR